MRFRHASFVTADDSSRDFRCPKHQRQCRGEVFAMPRLSVRQKVFNGIDLRVVDRQIERVFILTGIAQMEFKCRGDFQGRQFSRASPRPFGPSAAERFSFSMIFCVNSFK